MKYYVGYYRNTAITCDFSGMVYDTKTLELSWVNFAGGSSDIQGVCYNSKGNMILDRDPYYTSEFILRDGNILFHKLYGNNCVFMIGGSIWRCYSDSLEITIGKHKIEREGVDLSSVFVFTHGGLYMTVRGGEDLFKVPLNSEWREPYSRDKYLKEVALCDII